MSCCIWYMLYACMLYAVWCMFSVVCCILYVVCWLCLYACSWFDVWCMVYGVWCMVSVVYCVLYLVVPYAVCCMLYVVCCMLYGCMVVCCMLYGVCCLWLLFVVFSIVSEPLSHSTLPMLFYDLQYVHVTPLHLHSTHVTSYRHISYFILHISYCILHHIAYISLPVWRGDLGPSWGPYRA